MSLGPKTPTPANPAIAAPRANSRLNTLTDGLNFTERLKKKGILTSAGGATAPAVTRERTLVGGG